MSATPFPMISMTYTVNVITASGTITPKVLTATASGADRTYDGTTADAATLNPLPGVLSGDSVTDSYIAANFADKDVGTAKTVTVTGISLGGSSAADYSVNGTATATATISPALLTISAVTDSRTYNGTASSTVAPTVAGLFSGDTVTGASQSFNTKDVNATTLSVNTGYTVNDGNGGNNYAVATDTASGSISSALLTIHAVSEGKIYDGTAISPLTPTVTGLFSGDTVTGLHQTFASKDALGSGNSVLFVNGYTVNDSNPGDYVVVTIAASGTIAPAILVVTAATDTKTYDGTNSSAATPIVTGLGLGDTVTGAHQTFASKDVLGTDNSTLFVSNNFTLNGNASDYAVVTRSATGTITPAPLSITAVTDSKTYNGTSASSAVATVSGLVATDAGNLNVGPEVFDSANAGARTLSVSGYTLSNPVDYTVTTLTASGTISPAAITVSTSNVSKTYDGTTSVTGAAPVVTGGTLYVNQSNGGTQDALSGGSYAYTDANAGIGTKTVTTSGVTVTDGNNGGNYTVTYADNTTSTINKAGLTVTADPETKVYGDADPALTYTETGLVSGETLTGGLTRDAGENVNSYAITQGTLSASSNYMLTYVGSSLSISQAPLTIFATPDSKTYDATDSSGATPTAIGLKFSDNISNGVEVFDSTNAGSRSTSVSSYTVNDGNNGDNYNVTTVSSPSGLSQIFQAPLTIQATTDSKTYDTTASSKATPVAFGLQGSDTLASGTEVFDSANAGSRMLFVNSYTINDGNNGNNYFVTPSTPALGVINRAGLIITAASDTKVYDGTTVSTAAPTVSGLLGFDTISLNGEFFGSKDVLGTGNSVLSVTGGFTIHDGNNGNNYIPVVQTASGTITQAALTISAVTDSKVYDATDASGATPTYSGLQSGDSLTLLSQAFASKDVNGTNGSTLKVTDYSLTDSIDYLVSLTPASGTITPKALTVTATGINKVYDTTTGATVTLADNAIGSDDVTAAYIAASFADKNVGTAKPVSVSGISLSGADAGNYAFNTTATTAANITPASLTVSATGINKVYDATTSATVTLADNVLGSDDVTAAYIAASFADKNVGTAKPVSVSGISLSGADAGNYAFNTTATTASNITPASLTVTATGVNKVYDTTTGAAVTLADNVLGSDVVTASYTAASFADKNVGTAKPVSVSGISLSGADAGNYTFNTTTTAAANITPASLTVSATGVNKVYDTTTGATVTLADNVLGSDVVTASYTAASFADKNVGTAKPVSVSGISLSGADAGNYTFNTTATTAANITPASLTVSATGVNKVYDTTTGATITLADNALGSDVVTAAYTAASFADKKVGTYKPVSVSGISLSGADAGNYTFNTTATTTANITPASLTVSATGVNKVYDTTTAATVTLADNVLGSDVVNPSYGAASFADKNVGTAKPVSVSGISLSGADAGNYTFNTTTTTAANITPASLTVSATGVNKVYDTTTAATVTLADNVLGSDVVTAAYTAASFADKNVGTAKPVSVSGISLSGADAGNYTFNTTTTTAANITPASLTATASGVNKVYDGTTTATVILNPLSGVIGADVVTDNYATANFSDKNVGTAKTITVAGISLGGASAANYTVNTTATTTADITPVIVTITALTATATGVNKVYDGTTAATVILNPLSGVVSGDIVTDSYAAAHFADKNAGTAKTVTVTGISLGGASAANYTVNGTTTTTANITPAGLTITALTDTKVYDGTPSAPHITPTVSGSLKSGDTLTGASESFASKNVLGLNGSTLNVDGYTINDGNSGHNYAVTLVSAKGTITPAALTIAAVTDTKVYDGTTTADSNPTVSGLKTSDKLTVSATEGVPPRRACSA